MLDFTAPRPLCLVKKQYTVLKLVSFSTGGPSRRLGGSMVLIVTGTTLERRNKNSHKGKYKDDLRSHEGERRAQYISTCIAIQSVILIRVPSN
jgi:hypothetical protein